MVAGRVSRCRRSPSRAPRRKPGSTPCRAWTRARTSGHATRPRSKVATMRSHGGRPLRRSLYLYVVGRPDAVGRDEAASAVGIGRPLAAFHLDRLVEAGRSERRPDAIAAGPGPGAGRPASCTAERTSGSRLSLPERRDDVVARLFAVALEAERLGTAPGTGPARTRGERLWGSRSAVRLASGPARGRHGQAGRGRPGGPGRPRVRAVRAGQRRVVVLGANCPFDRIAQDHRDLVLRDEPLDHGRPRRRTARSTGIRAVFDPQAGRCCMTFEGAAVRA